MCAVNPLTNAWVLRSERRGGRTLAVSNTMLARRGSALVACSRAGSRLPATTRQQQLRQRGMAGAPPTAAAVEAAFRKAAAAAAAPRMKVIGILGGMSPSSTELYYNRLNTVSRETLGGLHSADCLIRSVDFQAIATLQTEDNWEEAGELLGEAAAGLEAGGAEVLILATNTMHKVAPAIQAAITIPFIDIFSATAEAVVGAGCPCELTIFSMKSII